MYGHPLVGPRSHESVPALLQAKHASPASLRERSAVPTVLVPLDGSALSQPAIDYVVALAGSSGIYVHLLNVQPAVTARDVTLFTSARAVEMHRRSAGERALGPAKRALAAAEIPYVAEVAFGAPVDEIVRCATSSGCSKIVMATRGRGLVSQLLGRSVARRVTRLAPVPVTLVKPPLAAGAVPVESGASAQDASRRLCTWRKRSCAPTRAYQGS
jgi:nucleotide-binding universal stress UspA family protein